MSASIDPTARDLPEPQHRDASDASDEFTEFSEIGRGETLVRAGLTLLFVVVNGVLNSVLGVTILFELLWSLIAKVSPSAQIRSFANRIVAFQYRIGRYMTYNESVVPFPFSEFPAEVEPGAFDPEQRDSEQLGLSSDWMERARPQARAEDGSPSAPRTEDTR